MRLVIQAIKNEYEFISLDGMQDERDFDKSRSPEWIKRLLW